MFVLICIGERFFLRKPRAALSFSALCFSKSSQRRLTPFYTSRPEKSAKVTTWLPSLRKDPLLLWGKKSGKWQESRKSEQHCICLSSHKSRPIPNIFPRKKSRGAALQASRQLGFLFRCKPFIIFLLLVLMSPLCDLMAFFPIAKEPIKSGGKCCEKGRENLQSSRMSLFPL